MKHHLLESITRLFLLSAMTMSLAAAEEHSSAEAETNHFGSDLPKVAGPELWRDYARAPTVRQQTW